MEVRRFFVVDALFTFAPATMFTSPASKAASACKPGRARKSEKPKGLHQYRRLICALKSSGSNVEKLEKLEILSKQENANSS